MTSDDDDGVGRSLSFVVSSMCVCECVKEGFGEEGVSVVNENKLLLRESINHNMDSSSRITLSVVEDPALLIAFSAHSFSSRPPFNTHTHGHGRFIIRTVCFVPTTIRPDIITTHWDWRATKGL